MEWEGRLDPANLDLLQHPSEPTDRGLAIDVDDEDLRDQRIVVRRDAIAGFDRRVDPDAGPAHPRTVEVVVVGWRFELEVEDARRADLRERARRNRGTAPGAGGPLEIHAMIPGRVVAVAVAPGDVVAAGQTLLVVEAMKMQNELRTPRDGTVERVAVGVGETIDLGDLLVVLG